MAGQSGRYDALRAAAATLQRRSANPVLQTLARARAALTRQRPRVYGSRLKRP